MKTNTRQFTQSTAALLLVFLSLLFFMPHSQPTAQASEVVKAEASPLVPLCDVPSENGRLFHEPWMPPINMITSDTWVTAKRTWNEDTHNWGNDWSFDGDWVSPNNGIIRQNSITAHQANIAFEYTHNIADGVILGCLQLGAAPPVETPFPHGLVFRMKDWNNFYGVGFLDNNTLVLGKLVDGIPYILATSSSTFTATDLHRFKIVLKEGSAKVYVALGEADFPLSPTLQVWDNALLSDKFRAGKIGLGTYEVQGDFGAIAINYDCGAFGITPANSSINGIVLQETGPQFFCGNFVTDLISLPDDTGPHYDDEAYLRFAQMIANAKSEVAFTSMDWGGEDFIDPVTEELTSGVVKLALVGNDPDGCITEPLVCNGLMALLRDFRAHPENHPYGVTVRILVGYPWSSYNKNISQVFEKYGIPFWEKRANGTEWRVEIARFGDKYQGIAGLYGRWSHVKLLVTDGKEAIISGYNMHNDYYNGEKYDLGVHVYGPIAYEAMTIFDRLWNTHVLNKICVPPDSPNTSPFFKCYTGFFIHVTHNIEKHAPDISAIEYLPAGDFVYSLYRNKDDNTASHVMVDVLAEATNEIRIEETGFTQKSVTGSWLGFHYALMDAIRNNAALNPDFKVRLLAGTNYSFLNRMSIISLINALEAEGLLSHFQVRQADLHTKAFSIDRAFMIVGSHNWDLSSWPGSSAIQLDEYSLGTSNTNIVNEFNHLFDSHWSSAPPSHFVPPGTYWPDANSGLVILQQGQHYANNLLINRPMTIWGGGGTMIRPNPVLQTGTEPLLHIMSSDVSIAGITFDGSSGYAIEIGDGVTPLENIFIADSIFTNNALGAIKINGPATAYYVGNNTLVGGESGIMINVLGNNETNTTIENNIFSGQTVSPIVVASDDDGGITYQYNLFDNCIRAVGGVCPSAWLTGTMNATSQEEYNLVNAPTPFIDATNGDYTPAYPSSAIDAALPNFEVDGYYVDGDTDGSVRHDMGAVEVITPTAVTEPLLISPQPGSIEQSTVSFVMTGTVGMMVEVQVATEAQFLTPLFSGNTQTYTTAVEHLPIGTYYWRARQTNGAWSPVRQFIVRHWGFLPLTTTQN